MILVSLSPNVNLIQVIEDLCNKATIQSTYMAAYQTGSERRSESDIQGCLLSLTPFHMFLKEIRTNALEDHKGIFSIWGRIITNRRVPDDIDSMEAEEEELASLLDHLDKISTPFGR